MNSDPQTATSLPSPSPATPPKDQSLRSKWEAFWHKDPVAERLAAITMRQRLFNLLAVLMFVGTVALIHVCVVMGLDRALELIPIARQLALLTTLGFTAAVAIILMRRMVFRRMDPLLYARKIDDALGFDDDALITYFDLSRKKTLRESESEVVGLLKEFAAERLNAIDVDQIVDARWPGRLLRVMGLCFGLLALLFVAWGGSFEDSFFRCVTPWQKIAPPRATRILDVLPGNATAVAGEPMKFTVTARGKKLPEWATLVYKLEGDSTELVERLERTETGKYERTLPGFGRAISYSVIVNTETKGPFILKTVERPLVTNVNARILPPTYAAYAPARDVEGGHIQAIVGSRVEITATANQGIASDLDLGVCPAWLQVGVRRIPMTVQGTTLKGALVATEDTEYEICYRGANGLTSREGVHFKVKTFPDAPPKATLQREGYPDAPADPGATVMLKGGALDDLGIRKLQLRVTVPGRSLQPTPRLIELSPATPQAQWQQRIPVDLAGFQLTDGEIVECVLSALDVKPPTGQSGISSTVRIPILRGSKNANEPKDDKFDDTEIKSRDDAKESSAEAKKAGGASSSASGKVPDDKNSKDSDSKRSVATPSTDEAKNKDAQKTLTPQEREDLARRLETLSDQREEDSKKVNKADAKSGDDDAKSREKKDSIPEQKSDPAQNAKEPENKGGDSVDKKSGQGEGQGKGESQSKDGDQGKGEGSNKGDGPNKMSGQGKENSPGNGSGQEKGSAPSKNEGPGKDNGQGKSEGQGKGDGQSKSGGPDQGNGDAQGKGNAQGKSDGKSNGQNKGEGPDKGEGQTKGDDSKQGDNNEASGQGGGSKSSSKATANPDAGKGRMPDTSNVDKKPGEKERLDDLAHEIRANKLDDKTLRGIKETLDHMYDSGRKFNSKDREKLLEAAKNFKRDLPPTAVEERDRNPATSPEGRARTELSGRFEQSSLQNRPGELKEDDQRKATDSELIHVAPEYKKSVEQYYKAVSH